MSVEDTAENAERCLCPGCPTYDECMRAGGQALFCARGKTECDPAPKTCLCGGCPVWADNGLGDYYYCLQGAAE